MPLERVQNELDVVPAGARIHDTESEYRFALVF